MEVNIVDLTKDSSDDDGDHRPVDAPRAPHNAEEQNDPGTFQPILDHMSLLGVTSLRHETEGGATFVAFAPPEPFMITGPAVLGLDLERREWRPHHVLQLKEIITQDATWRAVCPQFAPSSMGSKWLVWAVRHILPGVPLCWEKPWLSSTCHRWHHAPWE